MAKEADADIAAANDAFYSKQRTSPVRLHDMYDAVSVYGTSDGLTFKTANGHEAIIRMSQTTSLQLREILGIPTRDIIAKPKKMRKTPPRGKNEPPSAQVN